MALFFGRLEIDRGLIVQRCAISRLLVVSCPLVYDWDWALSDLAILLFAPLLANIVLPQVMQVLSCVISRCSYD